MTDYSHRNRLALPQVTLCAATSVNVSATLRALEVCLDQIAFADCILLTDAAVHPGHPEIRVVPIERLDTAAAYSNFMMTKLVHHVGTSHVLVAQWDGHVVDANRWQAKFLEYDYISASWPQFNDGYDVGNGGFSLRSRRLMEVCLEPAFDAFHPEDLAICRANRAWLEGKGISFAARELADEFATERAGNLGLTFGYHGVWNMPRAIGVREFWDVYRKLDDRRTLHPDFAHLLKDMGVGSGGARRMTWMMFDRLRQAMGFGQYS